jgi:hypothetical protein
MASRNDAPSSQPELPSRGPSVCRSDREHAKKLLPEETPGTGQSRSGWRPVSLTFLLDKLGVRDARVMALVAREGLRGVPVEGFEVLAVLQIPFAKGARPVVAIWEHRHMTEGQQTTAKEFLPQALLCSLGRGPPSHHRPCDA